MPDGFVALERFFRQAAAPSPAGESAESPPPAEMESSDEEPAGGSSAAIADVLAAARRFYAALGDALEAAVDELLRDIACDVLARELALAPADVASIAAAALRRYAATAPLRLRAHPEETGALEGLELPVVADAGLRRGDVVIDVRAGTIDASLGARLEHVLDRPVQSVTP
ncbi:MAG: FliH/SctL family protein [Candidatus Tumulicola sp.]